MRPFGTDRLRKGDDGSLILSCRISKGWHARVPQTLTTAEFPGTAVLWEDAYFEVIEEQSLPQGAVRYLLAPWREEHAIRVTDAYDEASEQRRAIEHEVGRRREKQRAGATLLGMFVGMLPAVVQEEVGSELGISPERLTMASVVSAFVAFGALVVWIAGGKVAQASRPDWASFLAGYLFLETAIRFKFTATQNRPIGSPLGLIVYILYWALAPNRSRRVSPFAVPKGLSLYKTEAPPDVALRDAFTMREPLLTLLSPEEQRRMAARFGFEYRKPATRVAVIFLLFAVAGVVSSVMTLEKGFRLSAFLSLMTAGYIAIEQIVRLTALPRGPAGSILGILVRPFTRKLFS